MSESYASTLPPALRAQRDRAEALLKQQNQPQGEGGQEGQGGQEGGGQGGQGQPPAGQPEGQQKDPQGQGGQTPRQEGHQQGQSGDPPRQEGSQQPRQENEQRPDDADHKYRSEKGRRERAEQTVRELQDQIHALREVVAAQQASGQQAPKPGQPAKPDEFKPFALSDADAITDQERQDYGPDLLALIEKQAKHMFAQHAAPLYQEIDRLRAQQGGVAGFVQQTSQDRFLQALDQNEPEWRNLNRDDAFLDWLDEFDPYAGAPRKVMFDQAVSERNSARAAAFFKGFLTQRKATDPAGSPPGASQPPAQGAAGSQKPTLADLAAPGKAKGAGTPASNEKPIWTTTEIKAFYDDVRRGLFQGRDAERQAFEADIIAASTEGRIRNA